MSILSTRKPASKPRSKPARFIRLLVGFNADGRNAVVRVREIKGKRQPRETADDYFVTKVAADFGQAFLVEKIGAEEEESRYHVNLAPDGHHSCECRGHLRWGHKTPCRHVAGLLALRSAGKL